MNRISRFVPLLIVGLVLLALPVAAQDGQSQPGPLACPAGYSLSAYQWTGELGSVDNTVLLPQHNSSFNLASPVDAQLTVWSAVGHPEQGCQIGTQGEAFPCDQGQLNEEFYIDVDGANQGGLIGDHGEDQWKFFGNISLGELAAGDHSIVFRHSTVGAPNEINSVFYLVGLCTQDAPPPPAQQGCTPGYWKQDHHFDSWVTYSPDQTLEDVFDVPDSFGLDSTTLVAALDGGGGPGALGGATILLRAAVAALLDAANPNVNYPRSTGDVINAVNAALASNDRDTMLALAGQLDADNNLGCPLN